MTTTLTISDTLAAALDSIRRDAGFDSLDAAAEALLTQAIALDDADDMGFTEDELRAAIAEGDASGPAEPGDAAAVREEVRRRARAP
jgi:hypothetical protein